MSAPSDRVEPGLRSPSNVVSNREKMIQRVLALRVAGEIRPGVYAGEVCQVCGKVATFDGVICAWGAHSSRDNAFVCFPCRKQGLQRTLSDETCRYCEICACPVPADQKLRRQHHWVCEPCAETVAGAQTEGTLIEFLNDFVRRRYIEIRYPTEKGVAALHQNLLEMRAVLEDLEDDPDEGEEE